MAAEFDELADAVDRHGEVTREYVRVHEGIRDGLPVARRRGGRAGLALLTVVVLVMTISAAVHIKRPHVVTAPTAVLAFPGAQGFAATTTTGGRGGSVIEVTNLNDSGAGSLREALSASGPRTVVFRVGGTINLSTAIGVYNGDITIAGQTAPGGGIAIRGWFFALYGSNAIVRGMRFRPGDTNRSSPDDSVDGIRIGYFAGPSGNFIVDHCSMSWAVDENIDSSYTPTNVTLSYNISSEALMDNPLSFGGRMGHGYGMILGETTQRITLHHNLFASNNERNPLFKGGTDSEFINNVVYNWRNYGSSATDPEGVGPQVANVVNNYYKRGPSDDGNGAVQNLSSGTLYVNGNTGAADVGGAPVAQQSGMTTTSAAQAYTDTLAGAGARAPALDSVDTRIISEASSGSSSVGTAGSVIASQTEVGSWPTLATGTAPTDTDHDGMPDTWETARGLNPNNASDRNDIGPSGYTRLEEYINSLLPTP